MKKITFSWTGTENSPEGHAIFKCDEVVILSLLFTEFRYAHAVSNAMNLCIQSGYEQGTRDALGVAVSAIRAL